MEGRARREMRKQASRQIPSKQPTEAASANRFEAESAISKGSKHVSDEKFDDHGTSLIRFDDQRSWKRVENVIAAKAPTPLLYHGNSDPFSSLSLKITPLIAELINFEHEHLHPCVYSNKYASNRGYGRSYFADIHGPETSLAAVYGYLSRAAYVLGQASTNPQYDQLAMVLKGKSSASLRAQLASGEIVDKDDVMRKILALMISEVFSHNYNAGLIHSKVLITMLEQQSMTEELDMRFSFSVIYSEIQRACMSLTRPCFDVGPDGWVAKAFDTAGKEAFDAFVATLGLQTMPPDASVLGLDLAALFDEVRNVRVISQSYSTSLLYGNPTPLALYLPARVVLCLGKLVSYYLDHRQIHGQDSSPRILIHRTAVLTALYWVRKAGNIDSIKVSSSSTIYSAGPLYLGIIRELLSRFNIIASTTEMQLYQELRFWTLYIGALDEQGRGDGGGSKDAWFTKQLVKAAADCDVYTWQQARLILEKFPYTDVLEPHGSTWFPSIFAGPSPGGTWVTGTFGRHFEKRSSEEADYFAHITDQTLSALSKDRLPHAPVAFESRLPTSNLRHHDPITTPSSSVYSHTGKGQRVPSVTPTPPPVTFTYRSWARSWDMLPESHLYPLHNKTRPDPVFLEVGGSLARKQTDTVSTAKSEAPADIVPPSGFFTCNSWDNITEHHAGTRCQQRHRAEQGVYIELDA